MCPAGDITGGFSERVDIIFSPIAGLPCRYTGLAERVAGTLGMRVRGTGPFEECGEVFDGPGSVPGRQARFSPPVQDIGIPGFDLQRSGIGRDCGLMVAFVAFEVRRERLAQDLVVPARAGWPQVLESTVRTVAEAL